MLRFRYLIALGALACLAGCASKPPKEVLGVWERTDSDPFATTTQRLKLTEKGNFRVTHRIVTVGRTPGSTAIADPSPLTSGPVDAAGFETLQRGTFQVKDGTLIFTTLHMWVAGVDVGPTMSDRLSESKFAVSGNTIRIQPKGLLLLAAPQSLVAPAPQAAANAAEVVLTRTQ